MELSTFRSLSIGDTVSNTRGQRLPVTNQYIKIVDGVPVSHIDILTVSDDTLTLSEEHVSFIRN